MYISLFLSDIIYFFDPNFYYCENDLLLKLFVVITTTIKKSLKRSKRNTQQSQNFKSNASSVELNR